MQIVRTPRGDFVGQDLVKPTPQQSDPKRLRLSDVFRLRRLALRRGKVIFEDRTRPDAAVMVWEDLTTDLAIAPRSASQYQWRFTSDNPGFARLSADGTFDIDALDLAIERFALEAAADPRHAQPRPADDPGHRAPL